MFEHLCKRVSRRLYHDREIREGATMFTPDHRAHLKLKRTPPSEVRPAAFAEAIFLAMALRGSPACLPQAGATRHAGSAQISEGGARPAAGERPA
jgi:hypothetical protein